jgi:hypothetical protein
MRPGSASTNCVVVVEPSWIQTSTSESDRQRNALAAAARQGIVGVPEQWLVLVTCRDEKQRVELLEPFGREGVECGG